MSNNSGPVIPHESSAWIDGGLSSREYFDNAWASAYSQAELSINRKVEQRKRELDTIGDFVHQVGRSVIRFIEQIP